MIKHPLLKLAEKSLKSEYTLHYKDSDILEISLDKDSMPFAFLIVDNNEHNGYILSLSYDFPETFVVASLTISLMKCSDVFLGESFYRSNNGILYWGEDAFLQFQIENDSDLLMDLIPISETFN